MAEHKTMPYVEGMLSFTPEVLQSEISFLFQLYKNSFFCQDVLIRF